MSLLRGDSGYEICIYVALRGFTGCSLEYFVCIKYDSHIASGVKSEGGGLTTCILGSLEVASELRRTISECHEQEMSKIGT